MRGPGGKDRAVSLPLEDALCCRGLVSQGIMGVIFGSSQVWHTRGTERKVYVWDPGGSQSSG